MKILKEIYFSQIISVPKFELLVQSDLIASVRGS